MDNNLENMFRNILLKHLPGPVVDLEVRRKVFLAMEEAYNEGMHEEMLRNKDYD